MSTNRGGSRTPAKKDTSKVAKPKSNRSATVSTKNTTDPADFPPKKLVVGKLSRLQSQPTQSVAGSKGYKQPGLNDHSPIIPIASSNTKTGLVLDAVKQRQADKKKSAQIEIEKTKTAPPKSQPPSRVSVLADKASKVYGLDKNKSKTTSNPVPPLRPSSRANNVQDMNQGSKWKLDAAPWERDRNKITSSPINLKLNVDFNTLPNYDGFLLCEGQEETLKPKKPKFPDAESTFNKAPLYLAKNRGTFFLTRTTAGTSRYIKLQSKENGDSKNDDLPEYKLRIYRGFHKHHNIDDGEKYVYYCDPVSGYSRFTRLDDVSARIFPDHKELKALYYWDWRREPTQAYIPLWHEDGQRVSKERNLSSWNHACTRRKTIAPGEHDPSVFDQFIFYCNLLRQISVSVPETWSVFARYWDKSVTGITLYVVLNDVEFPELFPKKQTSKSINVKKLIAEIQETKALAFQPTSIDIKLQSAFTLNVEIVGEHVLGLYSTYVSKTDLRKLAKEGLVYPSRPYPTKKLFDNVDGISFQRADKTRTHVTVNKITQASAIKIRKPSQVQVMDSVSASDVAETFWPREDIWRAAEWLHRSAYSFGGLGGPNVLPRTSQDKANLVFGTYEANTWMLRFESSIKHLTDLEKKSLPINPRTKVAPDPPSWVTTTLIYGTSWSRSDDDRPSWFAHGLQYNWSFSAASRQHIIPNLTNVEKKHDIYLFHRQTPMRFEAYLDEALENAIYKL